MSEGDVRLRRSATPHLKSTEWQSFEVRMRHRRAARCRLRAEIAIEAGQLADARMALDEARMLDPDAVQIGEIENKLTLAEASAAPDPTIEKAPRRGWRFVAVAGAAAALLLMTWIAVGSRTYAPNVRDAAASAAKRAPAAERAVRVEQLIVAAHEIAEQAAAPAAEPATLTAAVGTSGNPPPEAEPPVAQLLDPPIVPTPVVTGAISPPDAADKPAFAGGVQPSAPSDRAEPVSSSLPEPPLPRAPELPSPRAPEPADARAAEPAPRDDVRVRSVLSRFEAAYSTLDPSAAQSVWPTVDGRALARAFESLESQTISLDRCNIAISGASAHANCSGTATWTPKVGGGPRTEARRWTFDLSNEAGDWQIVQARVR